MNKNINYSDNLRNERILSQHREYYEQRRNFIKLPLENKAQKSLAQFRLYWQCAKGVKSTDKIPDEKINMALAEAKKFFSENQQRTIIDLMIWRKVTGEFSTLNSISEMGLRVLANAMMADTRAIESEQKFAGQMAGAENIDNLSEAALGF